MPTSITRNNTGISQLTCYIYNHHRRRQAISLDRHYNKLDVKAGSEGLFWSLSSAPNDVVYSWVQLSLYPWARITAPGYQPLPAGRVVG